jgi:NitT/TauT family transport system substrate-binding protein
VGRKLFPATEADLIAELVRRDLPYYQASIAPNVVVDMNAFARHCGLLQEVVPYQKVVATEFAHLWT